MPRSRRLCEEMFIAAQPQNSGQGTTIFLSKQFRDVFNGDEIHCLRRLRREGSPERLSRS